MAIELMWCASVPDSSARSGDVIAVFFVYSWFAVLFAITSGPREIEQKEKKDTKISHPTHPSDIG